MCIFNFCSDERNFICMSTYVSTYSVCAYKSKELCTHFVKFFFPLEFLLFNETCFYLILNFQTIPAKRLPGFSVGIVTDYGLDGPGIESPWGRDFPPVQTGPGAHPASCTMGTGSFPGVKCGRGVTLTPHLFLVPLVMKE